MSNRAVKSSLRNLFEGLLPIVPSPLSVLRDVREAREGCRCRRPGAVHGGPLLTVSLRVLFSGYHRLLRSIAAVDAGRREEVGRGPPHEVRLSLEVVARAVSLSSGKL
eukprot:767880-Hanusia_phi.AAC.8